MRRSIHRKGILFPDHPFRLARNHLKFYSYGGYYQQQGGYPQQGYNQGPPV